MADSLVLTGTRQVTKHTGTEMLRTDAKRGGNTWQLPRWWVKGNGTVYVSCTVFKVVAGGETGYLAIEASGEGVSIKITHDGSFNFAFSEMNEVSRAALYDSSMALVEHYVFPRISGGQTMVVTPPNGADRPSSAPAATVIGAVTIAGDTTADDEDVKSFTAAAASATASPLAYSWSANGFANITSGGSTATVTAELSSGSAILTCTVTSTDAGVTDSPAQKSITVTVT